MCMAIGMWRGGCAVRDVHGARLTLPYNAVHDGTFAQPGDRALSLPISVLPNMRHRGAH